MLEKFEDSGIITFLKSYCKVHMNILLTIQFNLSYLKMNIYTHTHNHVYGHIYYLRNLFKT